MQIKIIGIKVFPFVFFYIIFFLEKGLWNNTLLLKKRFDEIVDEAKQKQHTHIQWKIYLYNNEPIVVDFGDLYPRPKPKTEKNDQD